MLLCDSYAGAVCAETHPDSKEHVSVSFPAHRYIIRISQHSLDLQEDFHNATLVNTTGLVPKEAESKENFEFKSETLKIENGTKLYIAIQAINEVSLTSVISNIVQAVKFIPPQEPNIPDLGTKMPVPSLTVFVFVATLFIF